MTAAGNPGALIVALPSATDPVNVLGDEPDKHVTMNWFGPLEDIPPELVDAVTSVVSTVAMISAPFEADVSGVAVLGEEGAKVLLLESAELVALRELLMTAPPVAAAMSAAEQFPNWTPHITLTYNDQLPAQLPESVTIDSLGLWLAGDKQTYALCGDKDFDGQFEDGSENENLISDDEDQDLFGPISSTKVVLVKDSGGLTAAGLHVFDESLHPRDRNGRFIKKFGVVKYLVHGKWGYGTVQGIYADSGQTKITATPSDLSGVPSGAPDLTLNPSQIYTAPEKKAHLPIGHGSSKKVGAQAGSNPGGMYELTVSGKTAGGQYKGLTKDELTQVAATEAANASDNAAAHATPANQILTLLTDINTAQGYLDSLHAQTPGSPAAQAMHDEHFADQNNTITNAKAKIIDLGGDPALFGEPVHVQTETVKYYVKTPKSKKHGQNEELANDLYVMAGVPVPAVDTGPDGNTYSEIIPGVHDMQQRLNAQDKGWMEKVQRNFAVDAWLGNRDVFGLTLDNIMTTTDGTNTPIRIDNGGALLFRAMGAPKTDFGSSVTELDQFRTGKKAKVFGPNVMSKEMELDGAERVLAIMPSEIDDAITARGLPKSLADTLKARRAYIANYYGLPLPESMAPDTPEVSTTAPLIDAADLSGSHGKRRTWHKMNLTEVGFISETGDTLYLPDSDEQIVIGVGEGDDLLTTVQTQSQWLSLLQEKGWDAPAMVKKWQVSAGVVRPDHGEHINGTQLASFQYERGDKIIDNNSGDAFYVMGVNVSAGSLLLRKQKGEGEDKALPFLYDVNTGGSFTMSRWDPPVQHAEDLPVEEKVQEDHVIEAADIPAPEPAVPTGLAVEASQAIQADLVDPLPDGSAGTSVPEVSAPESKSPSGVGMVLGDGNMAEPGELLISKVDGKSYAYVKKKGPYAIVTSLMMGDDQNKLLTKKASTLAVEGATAKEKAAIAAPTSANGKVPGVGQHAIAKDGHEGIITMVSPDGKFVFITDANGKKKRKSVGTVTITGAEETSEVQEPVSTLSPADEFKTLASWNISVGDQISANGTTWLTVKSVSNGEYLLNSNQNEAVGINAPVPLPHNSTLEVMHKPGVAEPMSTADASPELVDMWESMLAGEPLPEEFNPMDIPNATTTADLPGGYTPEPGEKVMMYGDLFYSSKAENEWHNINEDGTLGEVIFTDIMFEDTATQPNQEMVFGSFDEPYPTGSAHLVQLKSSFDQLAPGDEFEMSGHQILVLSYPSEDNSVNKVVAVQLDDDPNKIVPLYLNSIQPDTTVDVINTNMPTYSADMHAKINDVYDSAWKTTDQLEAEKDLVAVSYSGTSNSPDVQLQLGQQGVDPYSGWVMYDPEDKKFYSVEQHSAQVWDPDTHTWGKVPGQDSPLVESLPVIHKPDAKEYYGYEPLASDEIYTVSHTGQQHHEMHFIKNANGMWAEIDSDGMPQHVDDPELDKGWGAAWKIEKVYPEPTPDVNVNHGDSGAPTPPPAPDGPVPPFNVPDGYDTDGKHLAYKMSGVSPWPGGGYGDTNNGYLFEETEPGVWKMVHYAAATNQYSGLGGLTYDETEVNGSADSPTVFWKSPAASLDATVDTINSTVPNNVPPFDLPAGYDPSGKTLAKMSNGGVWEKQAEPDTWLKVQSDGTLGGTAITDNVVIGEAIDVWHGELQVSTPTPPADFNLPYGYDSTGKTLAHVPPPTFAVGQVFEKQGDSWIAIDEADDGSFAGLGTFVLADDEMMVMTPVIWTSPTPESLAPATVSYKGFTPSPGDKVMGTKSPNSDVVAYWAKTAGGDGQWHAISDNGGLAGMGVSDVALADITAIPGWEKQELYGFEKPPGGGTFNGYVTPEGSTVLKTTNNLDPNSDVSGFYFVTAPGWSHWYKIQNGTVDTTDQNGAYDTAMIQYALDDGFGSIVQGAMPDATNIPSTGNSIQPGAKVPTKIKGENAYLASPSGSLTEANLESIDNLGQLEEGQTLWSAPSYNSLFVKTNTGDYHHLWIGGNLSPTPIQGSLSTELVEVKFTPTGPPTVGGNHVPPFPVPDGFDPTGKKLISAFSGESNMIAVEQPDGTYKVVAHDTGELSTTSLLEAQILAPAWDSIVKWDGTNGTFTNIGGTAPPTAVLATPPQVFDLPADYDTTGKTLIYAFNESNDTDLVFEKTGDDQYTLIKPAGWEDVVPPKTANEIHTANEYTNIIEWSDGSPSPAAPAPAPTPEPPAVEDKPSYPGSAKPDGAAVASWGGALTKDGYIPTSGMYVTGKGPMKGQITKVSKDKTKATVLTADGKKTTRLISALSVDTGKNYQVYAAPSFKPLMPVPDNMPIAVPAPKEALDTVFKTGKWMPIMHDNTKAVKSGSMFVQKATTPSGKVVARIHFVLTAQKRAKLLEDLAKGPDTPAVQEFGAWEAGSVPSLSGLSVGQNISMRLGSSNKWKVDSNGTEPTHTVMSIENGTDSSHKSVTLKSLDDNSTITSSFKDGFTVPVFTWDPNKPKPVPVVPASGGNQIKLSDQSKLQGWKVTSSNDWTIAGLTGSQTAEMGGDIVPGGGVVGKLKVEPGQPVTSSNKPWNHYYSYGSQPGLRKVNTDGSVIEVLSPGPGVNSNYGYTVITVPEGEDAPDVMQKAFEDLGMPYVPMTQDGAKAAVRGNLKQMLNLSLSDNYKGAQDSPAGDAAMFAKAGEAMGIPDLGWQDVEIGTDDSGTTLYFWSARAREAMANKTKMGSIVRAIGQPDPDKIESTLVYGTADTAKKWVAGMPTSSSGGNAAGVDASNLAGNGSFSSAIGKSSAHLPDKNTQWGGATVAHTNPMNLIARIMDYRPGHPGQDAFGKGQGNGANSLKIVLNQSQIQDFYPGGGLPGETIGFYAVDTEQQRQKLISHFHTKGRSMIGGRKIEDIILTKSELVKKKQSDLPPVWLPPNLTPILALPESYPSLTNTSVVSAA